MLRNYIKIAWRNLTKNKSYAFINIGGLAIALAVFIIIMLFVRHELSYDQFFSESDNIYRVLMAEDNSAFEDIGTQLPEPVVNQLKELYPEVEHSVMTSGPYRDVLLKGESEIYSDKVMGVGPEFFSVFDFEFTNGNRQNALSQPNTVVVTEHLARELFGTNNVVGKTVTQNNSEEYTITGVLKNLPANTHFEAEAFAHRPPNDISKPPFSLWNMQLGKGYISLSSPDQIQALKNKMEGYVKEYQNLSEGDPRQFRLILQPLQDIHLYPQSREAESSRMFYIQVLLIVAGLILLIACINYMNMATARSAGRAREIGIRKTVGAHKWQVITQVMTESVITCCIAFMGAFLLAELFKPLALYYFDINLGSLYEFSFGWLGFLAGLVITVSITSGAYAAFYLSSFEPSAVLKGGSPESGRGATGLRKVLVVAQFTISIAIVIVSLLVSKQMDFVRTERLNGNDAQVMVIKNNSRDLPKQFDAFKNEMLQRSSIQSVSAGTIPNQISSRATFADSTGGITNLYYFSVTYDYLKTMGLQLVNGRDFNAGRGQDSTKAVILNATAAKKFGYDKAEEQAVGRVQGKKLIGIVEDFHSHTLFDPIEPVAISIMNLDRTRMGTILVRLKENQIASGIDDVRAVWSDFAPGYPLNFSFMDNLLDQDYRAELRLAKIFNVFSVFSILIACLGLFGLAAFSAERRTKEIGIRKVLGATVSNIVGLLSKDFLNLVALGFIIAVPIAYYAMNQWLADFAYKIEIGPGIFLLAGGLALLIALATVSWQSIRAALANPVDSLRSE